MPGTPTPRLGYETIAEGDILAYPIVNEGTAKNDALVQTTVISRSITAPPGSPSEGHLYIVPAGATGAWAGHVDAITEYFGGTWVFYPPELGWHAGCQAEDGDILKYTSGGWVTTGGSPGGSLTTYKTNFTGVTTLTITGATHAFATADLEAIFYDNATPRNRMTVAYTVHPGTFDFVATSPVSISGRVILVKLA